MKLSKLFLILTILSIPLGQLGRFPGMPKSINLYFTDILVLFTVGWWLVYSLLIKRVLRITKTSIAILAFAFVALVSLLWGVQKLESIQQVLVSASYLARWVIYAGLYFVVVSFGKKERGEVFKWLIVSGILLSFIGFVQLLFFPDWSQFTYLGWDPHKNRLLSTFFDPNFCGIYLVLVINLILDKMFLRRNEVLLNLYTGLLICTTALFLTFSRSAWLAMAVSIFVWGLLKSRKLLLIAVVVAFLAYFAIPRVQTRIAGGFDPDDSARLRFQSWSQTWDIAKDNLTLGVGFNTFRYVQAERGVFNWRQPLGGHAGAGSDSSLLFVLATTGIIGLVSYLGILTIQPFNNLAICLKTKHWNTRSVLLFSVLVTLLINSLFINSLFYPPIMIFSWILLANLSD